VDINNWGGGGHVGCDGGVDLVAVDCGGWLIGLVELRRKVD
jgi:hypothetical protein